jgi:hypothetical protein
VLKGAYGSVPLAVPIQRAFPYTQAQTDLFFRSLPVVSQVAALQRPPPFQVKWLIAFSFNLQSLQLNAIALVCERE